MARDTILKQLKVYKNEYHTRSRRGRLFFLHRLLIEEPLIHRALLATWPHLKDTDMEQPPQVIVLRERCKTDIKLWIKTPCHDLRKWVSTSESS